MKTLENLWRLAAVGAGAALWLSGCASTSGSAAAESVQGLAATTVRSASSADAQFLQQAARNSHVQLQAARVALARAHDARVRLFAHDMVDLHERANIELAVMAQDKGVALPLEPAAEQRAGLTSLDQSEPTAFDQRYSEVAGLTAQQETVDLYLRTSDTTNDPDVRAFALRMLPSLQHQMELARDMKTAVAAAK